MREPKRLPRPHPKTHTEGAAAVAPTVPKNTHRRRPPGPSLRGWLSSKRRWKKALTRLRQVARLPLPLRLSLLSQRQMLLPQWPGLPRLPTCGMRRFLRWRFCVGLFGEDWGWTSNRRAAGIQVFPGGAPRGIIGFGDRVGGAPGTITSSGVATASSAGARTCGAASTPTATATRPSGPATRTCGAATRTCGAVRPGTSRRGASLGGTPVQRRRGPRSPCCEGCRRR